MSVLARARCIIHMRVFMYKNKTKNQKVMKKNSLLLNALIFSFVHTLLPHMSHFLTSYCFHPLVHRRARICARVCKLAEVDVFVLCDHDTIHTGHREQYSFLFFPFTSNKTPFTRGFCVSLMRKCLKTGGLLYVSFSHKLLFLPNCP